MTDLAHTFGSDLTFGADGDLLLSSGSQAGLERVLRRLLTNPGDYVWRVGYGAGLASFVGQPVNEARIQGIALAQMAKERAVAQNPLPAVDIVSNNTGTVTLTVRYVDAPSGASIQATAAVAY